jgi:hypothetical protein
MAETRGRLLKFERYGAGRYFGRVAVLGPNMMVSLALAEHYFNLISPFHWLAVQNIKKIELGRVL